MKKLILLALLLISLSVQAQTTPLKTVKIKDVSTKDTTIKSVVYALYVGKNGGKYIVVTSKVGNQYKKYFSKHQ